MLLAIQTTMLDALKRTIVIKFDRIVDETPSILDNSQIPMYSIDENSRTSKYVYVFDQDVDAIILEQLWDQYPDAVDIMSWIDYDSGDNIENMSDTLDGLVYEWEELLQNIIKYGTTYEDIMNILYPILNGMKFDSYLDTYKRYHDAMDIISYAREYLLRYSHIRSIYDYLYNGDMMVPEALEFLSDVFVYYFVVPSLYNLDMYGFKLIDYLWNQYGYEMYDLYGEEGIYDISIPFTNTSAVGEFIKFMTNIQSRRDTLGQLNVHNFDPLIIESIPVNDLADIIAALLISRDTVLQDVTTEKVINEYNQRVSRYLNQSESKIVRRLMEDYSEMITAMKRLGKILDEREYAFIRNFLALRYYQGTDADHNYWRIYTGPIE